MTTYHKTNGKRQNTTKQMGSDNIPQNKCEVIKYHKTNGKQQNTTTQIDCDTSSVTWHPMTPQVRPDVLQHLREIKCPITPEVRPGFL